MLFSCLFNWLIVFISACSHKIDIVILIDSTHFTSDDWPAAQIGFGSIVKTIDRVFPIGSDGVHVGVANYDDQGHLVSGLKDGTSATNAIDAIQSIQPPSVDVDISNLKDGFTVVQNEFATNSRGNTEEGVDTYQIVIVVVNTPVTGEKTYAKAEELKTDGISIISIAVSPELSLDSLRLISTIPDNTVYEPVKSLPTLWNNPDSLKSVLCPTPAYCKSMDYNSDEKLYQLKHFQKIN